MQLNDIVCHLFAEIFSYPVIIYPENYTIPLKLTIQEQGNYSIELCCINNTVQDVCIHSKLTLNNNKTTKEVSSLKIYSTESTVHSLSTTTNQIFVTSSSMTDSLTSTDGQTSYHNYITASMFTFSNTLKQFSTIDSLSTVAISTISSYKTNSIQMSSIIIMGSSLKQTVQESPVYSSFITHNSLTYQNNSASLKHVQESPVYSSHITHNKLTNQNTAGNNATPSVVGLSEPTAVSFTTLNMGLISVIGLMILLLILMPVVMGYLCYRKGGKNSIVLINPEGSGGSAITITTLKTMHKRDLRVSEVGAPSDLNNGHDVEEIETRFTTEEVEQDQKSVDSKLSVAVEIATEDEVNAPATYELEEKNVEPITSHDAVENETSFTKKDESNVELEDRKSVNSKLSVVVDLKIATEDEVNAPTYRLEEENLEPTTSHDAVEIETSFTTEKLIKKKLKMEQEEKYEQN